MKAPWRGSRSENRTLNTNSPSSVASGVIHLESVESSYPGSEIPAIRDFSLLVQPGEFISILGRSGAGKTTALRVIAGFEHVTSGYVRIGGQLVGSSFVHITPDQRRIGLVFQDYALFPHLSVAGNVEFGLKGYSTLENRVRAAAVVDLVGMGGYESRFIHELSGGQQQRVAIARALAPDPIALLMDEPFSNLDKQLRTVLRRDVKNIVTEAGATTILVTHDREEALATSDRVAVMGDRSIEQIGTPEEVYLNPVSAAVAKLIGPCELISGSYRAGLGETEAGTFPARELTGDALSEPKQVLVLMRASELEINAAKGTEDRGGIIELREFEGEFSEYTIRLDSGALIRVRRRTAEGLSKGQRVIVQTRNNLPLIVFPNVPDAREI